MSTAYAVRRSFLAGPAGDLFVSEFVPESPASTLTVIVPPFAEEMNRARRMMTLLGHRLACRGVHVCLPDLFGTGDSDGNFVDAGWDTWLQDLRAVVDAARKDRTDSLVMLGIRLGALLAADAVYRAIVPADRFCFWSPCLNGELFMTQFLRLRLMAGMIAGDANRESVTDLRSRLRSGETLEVAGYELAPELVARIDSLKLVDCIAAPTPAIDWIEVVADASRPLSPPVERTSQAIAAQGIDVRAQAIAGPPFWSTAEIAVSGEVLDATSRLLAGSAEP